MRWKKVPEPDEVRLGVGMPEGPDVPLRGEPGEPNANAKGTEGEPGSTDAGAGDVSESATDAWSDTSEAVDASDELDWSTAALPERSGVFCGVSKTRLAFLRGTAFAGTTS